MPPRSQPLRLRPWTSDGITRLGLHCSASHSCVQDYIPYCWIWQVVGTIIKPTTPKRKLIKADQNFMRSRNKYIVIAQLSRGSQMHCSPLVVSGRTRREFATGKGRRETTKRAKLETRLISELSPVRNSLRRYPTLRPVCMRYNVPGTEWPTYVEHGHGN